MSKIIDLMKLRLELVAEFAYYKYMHNIPVEDRCIELNLENIFMLTAKNCSVDLERAKLFLYDHFKKSKEVQYKQFEYFRLGGVVNLRYSLEEYRKHLQNLLIQMVYELK